MCEFWDACAVLTCSNSQLYCYVPPLTDAVHVFVCRHPCHSGWVQDMLDAAEDNLQQQRIRELCAYILAGDNEESVDPETYTTNDLSSPDNGGWRTVTQLPYTCMVSNARRQVSGCRLTLNRYMCYSGPCLAKLLKLWSQLHGLAHRKQSLHYTW